MKKRSLLLTSFAGLTMLLSACGNDPVPSSGSSSSSTGENTSSSSTQGGGGSSTSSTSSSASKSSSTDDKDKEDVIYTGKIRIWYHNDAMNYDKKAIYLWNTSVDGKEYEFTGDDAEYGKYFETDLSTNEQFKDYPSTDIRLIIKQAGSWSGQSLDTFCYFKDYEVDDEGYMNIYTAAGEGSAIDTFARRADALGDHFDIAYVDSSWRKIVATGAGTQGTRKAEDVGKMTSVSLYGFTTDYYKLNAQVRASHDAEYLIDTIELSDAQASATVEFNLKADADPSIQYEVRGYFLSDKTKLKSKAVSVRRLYDTDGFKNNYVYNGDDLGVTFNADGTKTLRLWAPTSAYAQVRFYLTGTPWNLAGRKVADLYANFPMERQLESDGKWHGVWKLTTDSRSEFYEWYNFVVTNSNGQIEAVDPYAKATGLNGERGYMANFDDASLVDPEGWNDGAYVEGKLPSIGSANNLTVYEAHIRDLTADATWITRENNLRGTYNAFCEEDTTYTVGATTVKTGFDHIKELGVNAIQLLPVFDQDNDERQSTVYTSTSDGGTLNELSYNWGYNPQNYNVVEGAYSSKPESATTRIKEYKNLIMKAADNGIRIIMDVVYNHMSSVANNSFTKIVPQYFFRTDADGNYTDGSGCGNEFASERPMASKFIADSVAWWAKEYKIKGFRFDLMGCIDTDTMKAVRSAVNKVDPTIVLYGEGWTGGGSSLDGAKQSSTGNIYSQLNTNDSFPVGGFNDHGRDGAKGNTAYGSPYPSGGWINNGSNTDNVYDTLTMILGENRNVGTTPNQAVNYLACHDNYTLYDQINYLFYGHDGTFGDGTHEYVMQAVTGLSALSLFGQGIGFINGGDELFRQKIIKSDNPLFEELVESYKFGRYNKGTGSTEYQTTDWSDKDYNTYEYWTEGDGVKINDTTWLVRNSYKYGDAVNSFKWDRKADATVNKYYQKFVQIVALRQSEMKKTLGQSQAQVQAGGTTCWSYEDLFNEDGSSKTDILAGYFQDQTASRKLYIFANKGNGDASIGIGNGSFKVLYSSNVDRQTDSTITVSDNKMNVKKFETLIVQEL